MVKRQSISQWIWCYICGTQFERKLTCQAVIQYIQVRLRSWRKVAHRSAAQVKLLNVKIMNLQKFCFCRWIESLKLQWKSLAFRREKTCQRDFRLKQAVFEGFFYNFSLEDKSRSLMMALQLQGVHDAFQAWRVCYVQNVAAVKIYHKHIKSKIFESLKIGKLGKAASFTYYGEVGRGSEI